MHFKNLYRMKTRDIDPENYFDNFSDFSTHMFSNQHDNDDIDYSVPKAFGRDVGLMGASSKEKPNYEEY
jgi:hypothetical protein